MVPQNRTYLFSDPLKKMFANPNKKKKHFFFFFFFFAGGGWELKLYDIFHGLGKLHCFKKN